MRKAGFKYFTMVLVAVAVIAVPAASAQSLKRTKTGTLACDISSGIGVIMATKKRLVCLFTPAQPGTREVYSGAIVKFGADPGVAAIGEMVWAVYAPTHRRFGVLAGNYGGPASGSGRREAAVNALVGGSAATVMLQPVSIEGQGAANLAVGVAGLELHPAR